MREEHNKSVRDPFRTYLVKKSLCSSVHPLLLCSDVSTRRAQRDEKVPVEQTCARRALLPLGEGFVPRNLAEIGDRVTEQSRARLRRGVCREVTNSCRACSSGTLLLKNGVSSKQVGGDRLMVKVQERLSEELDKYNPSEHWWHVNEGCKITLGKAQPPRMQLENFMQFLLSVFHRLSFLPSVSSAGGRAAFSSDISLILL